MVAFLLELQVRRALAYAVILSFSRTWLWLVSGVFTCIKIPIPFFQYSERMVCIFEEYVCVKDIERQSLGPRMVRVVRTFQGSLFMTEAILNV